MKDVVVGGTGWVSRASLSVLQEKFEATPTSLRIFGSSPRKEFQTDGEVFEIEQWDRDVWVESVRYFLPFGFLGVDKFDQLGEIGFRKENRNLIQLAADFISRNKPEYCVLFSSGITHSNLSLSARSTAYQVYKELKLEEESAIEQQCEASGTKLVICRLFSASGRFMPDYRRFAIGNLIYQGLKYGKIQVENPASVWRKYVDMEQLLELCLRTVQTEQKLRVDSTGSLIELHHLATLCAKEVNVLHESTHSFSGENDNYFSTTSDSENLAETCGISLFPIERQIQETVRAVDYLLGVTEAN